MSINIKGISGKANSNKITGGNKANKSSTDVSTKKPSDDSVDLTEAASRIQAIEQSLSNIPVVDANLVDSISNSIKDGSYTVNDEKVADGIISSEKQILTAQKNND